MRAILDHCGAVPLEHMAGGSVILEESQNTGRVYVLVEGRIEVLRGGTEVTVLDEPGSLVGEMSVLLGVPHQGPSATPAEFDAGGSAVVTPAGSRAKSYRPGGPSKQWQLGGLAYLPARRLSDSAESESSSRSLFYRIFLSEPVSASLENR